MTAGIKITRNVTFLRSTFLLFFTSAPPFSFDIFFCRPPPSTAVEYGRLKTNCRSNQFTLLWLEKIRKQAIIRVWTKKKWLIWQRNLSWKKLPRRAVLDVCTYTSFLSLLISVVSFRAFSASFSIGREYFPLHFFLLPTPFLSLFHLFLSLFHLWLSKWHGA